MSERPNGNAEQMEVLAERLTFLWVNLSRPLIELIEGARTGALPWHLCLAGAALLQLAVAFHWDYHAFAYLDLAPFYPTSGRLFRIYYWSSVLSPFWLWGIYRAILKQFFLTELTRIFAEIGLRNGLKRPPKFIFDRRVDSQTRKLRLGRNGISIKQFRDRQEDLAGALQVYVDEVREDRTCGAVDIIYSPHKMPEEFKPDLRSGLSSLAFFVGTTRSKQYKDSLERNPHLLVGGQTGSGKSSFLRQLITSLFLHNRDMEFTLIDLKGGLEFQTFESLPRVLVIGNVGDACNRLVKLADEVDLRMKFLKANKCKDIYALKRVPEKDRVMPPDIHRKPSLGHHLIVVDEAAELFLVGPGSKAEQIQSARRLLSQIARQGRSIGIHLVIATQRPDTRALDPQVKANLTGILCFQMANDISSITVLGNGRATDLPPVPGRAIWKNALEMVEVQTPHLTVPEAEALLERFKTKQTVETNPTASVASTPSDDTPELSANSRIEEKSSE